MKTLYVIKGKLFISNYETVTRLRLSLEKI